MAWMEQVIIYGILMWIMLGLGCTVTKSDFLAVLRYKRAFLVGVSTQFGFMPFMGWSLCRLFRLNTAQSLGTIVVCSAPGGTYSNFFCYHTDGSLGLSISMTLFSTFTAFGMMPLMIWLWADVIGGFEDHQEMGKLDMDYWGLFLTLCTIIAPVGLGAFIRSTDWGRTEAYGWFCRKKKAPRWYWFNVTSGICGVCFIILAFIIGISRYGDILFKHQEIIIISSLITPVGSIFGFIFAKLCRLPYREALTVCWETGLQNIVIALGLIDLSFEDGGEPDKANVLTVPIHVAIMYNVQVGIMCLFFKFINKHIMAEELRTCRRSIKI